MADYINPLSVARYFPTMGDAIGWAMEHNAREAADLERQRRADPAFAHLYQDDETED